MGLTLMLLAEGTGVTLDWKLLLLAAAVVAVMALMPRLVRKNRQERQLLEKQYRDEVNNTIEVRSAADKILLQVVDAGREINGVLDTKIRVLNKLLKDADDAARRLEKLLGQPGFPAVHPGERLRAQSATGAGAAAQSLTGQNSSPVNTSGTTGGSSADNATTKESAGAATLAAISALSSLRAAAIAPAVGGFAEDDPAPAAPAAPAETADTGSGRWKADIRGRIRGYAEEGRGVDEIARLTRLSKAEVNLMLDLLRSEAGR